MSYTLLTGATGLLGRYLMRDLLLGGEHLAVIVRPGKLSTARQRIEALVQRWEGIAGRSMRRPVILEGDLRESDLGLDGGDLAWLRSHVHTAVHSAASLVFRAQPDGEPHRTNAEGTRRVLEVCQRAGVRHFHHVSTSYLCGVRTGRVLETELDLGQEAGNVYEASKLAAEKAVRSARGFETCTVHRPASIVGDSRTGYTTSYHGFYLPLQLAYTMSGRIPPEEMGERFFARLGLQGHEGKNFVPVDWVAAGMLHIIRNRRYHGGTYHLASPQPVSVRLIQSVTQDAIRKYSKRTTANQADPRDLAACEQLFHHHMQIYESHWRDDPQFDLTHSSRVLSHLPCPVMDYEQMMTIARYPIEHNFASPKHEKIEFEFDAQELLTRFISANHAANADRRVSLDVSGRGGGQWSLLLRGSEIVDVERGFSEDAVGLVYVNAHILEQLTRGDVAAADALAAGKLVFEAPSALHRNLLDAMGILTGQLSPQAA